MAPYLASVDIFNEVGMDALCEKRDSLTAYLEYLLDQSPNGYKLLTPRSKKDRGAQLSILIKKDAKKLNELLYKNGVTADYREPDVIRVAPVPLYNSYEDVFHFVRLLDECYTNL
jgi:kynureninase